MSQATTIDYRRSNLTMDLTLTAGEIGAATAQGDFARGQRHQIGRDFVPGDFATGMRTTSTPRVIGDFATGMRTSPRRMAIGDFATGMRTVAAPVVANDPTTVDTALPIAA
jgi:hypothetical protein